MLYATRKQPNRDVGAGLLGSQPPSEAPRHSPPLPGWPGTCSAPHRAPQAWPEPAKPGFWLPDTRGLAAPGWGPCRGDGASGQQALAPGVIEPGVRAAGA